MLKKLFVSLILTLSATFVQADSIASLTEKANQQDAKSQYLLAQSYELGVDVEENANDAFYWYSQAAKNGQVNAQKKVAYFLVKGIGTKRDVSEAARWYTQLALNGDTQAPLQLAKLYEAFPNEFKPLDLAEAWYQVALKFDENAEEGYNRVLEAQFNARKAKQLSSFEQLDIEFTEPEITEEPQLLETTTVTSRFNIQEYVLAALLVLLTAALLLVAKKTRAKRADNKQQQQKSLDDQVKSQQFTIKQQKRQLEAMFREVKKYQANNKTQKLKVACALFGYTPTTIPDAKKIKVRYKQLSKVYHPDLHGTDEEMKRLNAALKTILQNVTQK